MKRRRSGTTSGLAVCGVAVAVAGVLLTPGFAGADTGEPWAPQDQWFPVEQGQPFGTTDGAETPAPPQGGPLGLQPRQRAENQWILDQLQGPQVPAPPQQPVPLGLQPRQRAESQWILGALLGQPAPGQGPGSVG